MREFCKWDIIIIKIISQRELQELGGNVHCRFPPSPGPNDNPFSPERVQLGLTMAISFKWKPRSNFTGHLTGPTITPMVRWRRRGAPASLCMSHQASALTFSAIHKVNFFFFIPRFDNPTTLLKLANRAYLLIVPMPLSLTRTWRPGATTGTYECGGGGKPIACLPLDRN